MQFAGIPLWASLALAAAAAAALLALHLLRVRPRELRVVTTLFWASAAEQTQARTLLRRFRHPWTFVLLLLICVLLCLALSQPEAAGDAADQVWAVVVLDAGTSMAASDAAGGARLDAARRAVLGELSRYGAGDRVAVVVGDPQPRLLLSFDEPRTFLSRRLEAVSPAEVPALRQRALTLGRSLLHGAANAELVLVTDRSLDDDWSVAGDDPVPRVVRVGTPAANAGIVSAIFEPKSDDPFRGRFLARVAYWGEQAAEVALRIQRGGGGQVHEQRARIEPGATYDFAVDDLPADGDTIIVELLSEDALSTDDRAEFPLPLRRPIRVCVGPDVPAALRLALSADPAVRIIEGGTECDVVVEAETAESGVPAIVVDDAGAAAPNAAQVNVTGESPLTTGLSFGGALAGTGSGIQTGDASVEVLLRAGDVALAGLFTVGPAPRLHLGSALVAEDSPVVRRAAFAVLVGRAIRRLAGWDETPIALTPERATTDPLWAERSGVEARLAVMPGSRMVSDLGESPETEQDSAPARSLAGRPAWFEVLLGLALMGLLIEGVLHARGRIA